MYLQINNRTSKLTCIYLIIPSTSVNRVSVSCFVVASSCVEVARCSLSASMPASSRNRSLFIVCCRFRLQATFDVFAVVSGTRTDRRRSAAAAVTRRGPSSSARDQTLQATQFNRVDGSPERARVEAVADWVEV